MRARGTAIRAFALAVAAAAAAGCGGDRPRNLILVSIDTLRADRLGAYGYERPTSPWLDALAARGVRFETVIAESSWTLPSHVTLFTARAPGHHGVTRPTLRIPDGLRRLPEAFREHGFATFAFTGGTYLDPRFGFDRGFDYYHPDGLTWAGALAAAREALAGRASDAPFFLFLHTYDVHCPYDPPPGYALAFHSDDAVPVETAGRCGNPHYNAMGLRPAQARTLSDRYDASIRYVDDLLAGFAAWLDEEGLLADTLIAVVSDHGEELLDHGRIGHEDTLHREVLHVPWILAGPGLEPRVVTLPVGLADVAPTLLELLGIEDAALASGDGRSRAAVATGAGNGAAAASSDGVRFSENHWRIPLRSLVEGRHHLIEWPARGEVRLYDWREDPGEERDLWGADPERDRRLRADLTAYAARADAVPEEPAPAPRPDERERLRALGYLE